MNLHTATAPNCPQCLGHGQVCSAHPELAWGPGLPSGYWPVDRVCCCGAEPLVCPLAVANEWYGNVGRSVRVLDAVGLVDQGVGGVEPPDGLQAKS